VIYLIRHGESQANAGEATSHMELIRLTQKGLDQAKTLPLQLPEHIDHIIYSSYLRTYQTALPTIIAHPEAAVYEWPEIREFSYLNPDKCKNTTAAERRPMADAYWATLDVNLQLHPRVESFSQFIARVRGVWKGLQDRFGHTDETVALFTHGLFIIGLFHVIHTPEASDAYIMEHFFDNRSIKNGEVFELNLAAYKQSDDIISDDVVYVDDWVDV